MAKSPSLGTKRKVERINKMNPEDIAKTSEHSHQAAFFCWASKNFDNCPSLRFMHAIPNGGLRNKREATRLKAEGVRAGVPDVFFPQPMHLGTAKAKAGLYLEFKKPSQKGSSGRGLSPEQVEFEEYLKSCGYEHKVVYSWLQAAETTVEYLNS